MSTKGCHNCGVDFKDWVDKPYDQWPCAKCSLAKDYNRTFCTGYFDTAKMDKIPAEDRLPDIDEHDFITVGGFPLKEEEIQSLETIKAAVANQIYAMFSGILVRLLHMAKKNPIMFEVFIKKMQFPYMSYSDIGETMNPKCSKQNVLYHLKSVVKEFPELEAVIMTDTRYSGGHYALRTIADKRKQEIAEARIQQNLYGSKYASLRYGDISELNKILRSPFNIRDEVFNFNAYIKDEEHVDKEFADQD